MVNLDYDIQMWLGHVFVVRHERLSTARTDGIRHSYYWFDQTCPVIRDGEEVDNGCPLDFTGPMSSALAYEWGPEQQRIFEDVMTEHVDFARWDGLVDTLRAHWPNTAPGWGLDSIPWLEPIAAGVRPMLHELGKTKEFRGLRMYPRYDYLAEGGRRGPAQVGDPRLDGAKPERAEYRAGLIAARGMTEWFSHRYDVPAFTPQSCVICTTLFWPNVLDASELSRLGPPRYCHWCAAMMRRDVWTEDHVAQDTLRGILIRVARDFYELTNVFPYQGVKTMTIAGLPDDERDVLASMLLLIPTPDVAKAVFGSWQQYLHEAGLLEKAPRKGQSGYVTIANDGHVALSIGERIVCDWLHARGIGHDKEPAYPKHPEWNAGGKLRADWLINDCWVELAGRMDDVKYAENVARKQQLAAACGLRHFVLLPAELSRLDSLAVEHWRVTEP